MGRGTAGLGETARGVSGDSEQGSQEQDNPTSTGSPRSALTETVGNVALLPPQQGLPCLRHRSLSQLLRQISICCATTTDSGELRPQIFIPTMSSFNKDHKRVFLIPQSSWMSVNLKYSLMTNKVEILTTKQPYGAGFF